MVTARRMRGRQLSRPALARWIHRRETRSVIREYEDGTEELIIAVEQWEDESEYSKGCYLDMDEIVLLDSGCSGQVESNRTLGFVNMKNLAVAAVILAVLECYPIRTYSQE